MRPAGNLCNLCSHKTNERALFSSGWVREKRSWAPTCSFVGGVRVHRFGKVCNPHRFCISGSTDLINFLWVVHQLRFEVHEGHRLHEDDARVEDSAAHQEERDSGQYASLVWYLCASKVHMGLPAYDSDACKRCVLMRYASPPQRGRVRWWTG